MIRAIIVIGVALLSGCDSETPFIAHDYRWTQTEDGLSMMAPITITVRLTLNDDKLIVRMKAVDKDGKTDIQTNELPCSVFDDKNFKCALIPQDTFTMRDGVLFHDYWGEHRQYKKRLVIWGRPM